MFLLPSSPGLLARVSQGELHRLLHTLQFYFQFFHLALVLQLFQVEALLDFQFAVSHLRHFGNCHNQGHHGEDSQRNDHW